MAVPAVAAHAGAIVTFRFIDSLDADDVPLDVQRVHLESRELFGIDISHRHLLAGLGADPDRPIVVSWGAIDPAQLRAFLAAPSFPIGAPLSTRSRIVIPVADMARAAQALAGVPLDDNRCARATWEPARWAEALASLKDPADRRAVDHGGLVYFCRSQFTASLVRLDPERREVIWVGTAGVGALLADAAAPPALDEPLAARLERDGFFRARVGIYATPTDEANAHAAFDLLKVQRALTDIDPEIRDQLWRRGVWELGGSSRLIDSEPRLFNDVAIADGASSWTLTDAGKTFFAGLGVPPRTDAAHLKDAIVARMKPTGLFADQKALTETVNEAGGGAYVLIQHYLWPHRLAFAAATPDLQPVLTAAWSNARTTIDLDTKAGVLRPHGSGAN
jgi:hypothetical protein